MAAVNDFAEKPFKYLSTLGFRICVSTVSHPFDYAKFLIQIGHEPMAPYPSKSLFGRPVQALPNVFKYVGYIKNTDGFFGCYRGFAPKITGQIISTLVADSITQKFTVTDEFDPKEDEVSDADKWRHFKQTLVRDAVGKSVTIIVSQPFYVISARMMAQFVGGEEMYNGIFSSIKEIYQNEGILGFFTGLIPRWLGDLAALFLSSILIYGVNTYIIQDNELKSFTTATIQYISHAVTYPMTVVSACVTVNNCGLAAGRPPQMPVFDTWTHCFHHLRGCSQLNRGSGLFFRYTKLNGNNVKYLKP